MANSSASPKTTVAAFALVLLLPSPGCVPDRVDEPTLERLEISYSLWPGYYPLVIAIERGFLDKQGVEVERVMFRNTGNHIAEVAAGRYDASMLSLGSSVVVAGRDPGVRVVLAVDQSAGADAVVARPGIRTPADLKGKSVGTMLGSFGELFVLAMVRAGGLTPDDVTLVNITAPDVPAQLEAGKIDAGHTWEPYVTRATRDGARVVFTSRDSPGLIQDVVVFQQSTLRDRPAAVQGFVTAWFEALDFWLENPAAGDRIISQSLGIAPEECSLEGIELFTRRHNRAVFGLEGDEAVLATAAQQYAEFFVRSGNVSVTVDVDRLLDPSFLPASGP
jgi:NitT/TauT family transport system substrate-binding protein